MKALNFNKALLEEFEIKTLKAERTHLYNQLININTNHGMKYHNLAARLNAINKKLYKLTGDPIYS